MKLNKILVIVVAIVCLGNGVQAQNATWSLEKCIAHAWQNSLAVQQAELSMQQAALNQKQAWWAQFPNISASFSQGVNFGNSVNFANYERVNEATTSQSFGLNLNQPVFQGFQIRNSIRQSKVDAEASMKDSEQAKNDVALQVSQAYLSILLAEENKEVLVEQAKVTQAQYDQTLKLIAAGVVAENSKYDLEAQIARDEENIVNAQNAIDLAYVNLKLAMNVDVSEAIEIEKVDNLDASERKELQTIDEIYKEALSAQPNVMAAKLRERSAELGVQIAKGAFYPSLSFFGGMNTNYNSAIKIPTSFTDVTDSYTGTVDATGAPVTVQGPTYTILGDETPMPYFWQIGGFLSGNVGVNLSIPIFSQNRTRLNVKRAELGIKTAQLATKQVETTLKSNIQRAVTDVKAAAKRLDATEKSVIAIRKSVENTRKRYELGVVNSFELTSVQNTLIASESNLLQAKYDYLFKVQVLEYYKGNPIELK